LILEIQKQCPSLDVITQPPYQLKKGMKMPEPCRVCGVGLLCDYRLCKPCGGNTLKQCLICKREKAKKFFELVLLKLKERNTPFRETYLRL